MIEQLRTILLNQYIGAILIAFLWSQAIMTIAQLLIGPVTMILESALKHSNFSGAVNSSMLPWSVAAANLIYAIVLSIAGWLVGQWIYATPAVEQSDEPNQA